MRRRIRLFLTASRRIVRGIASRVPVALPTWRFVRDRTVPHHRALRRIAAESPHLLLQPANMSRQDRYPGIFDALRKRLAGVPEPHILSFGCSTGEEVFTLRRHFPTARITGIDINSRNIARAEARLRQMGGDPAIRFKCAGSADGELADSFHAVLALAVLRHGELQAHEPSNCEHVLPFAQVERAVASLVQCVAPGGYLAIWNCHFRFRDMAAFDGFEADWIDLAGSGDNSPLYGPDNRRLDLPGYAEALFRRTTA